MVKKIAIVTLAIMLIIKIFTCIPVEHVHSNENSWSAELNSAWIQKDNIWTQLDKIQFSQVSITSINQILDSCI